MIGDRGQRNKQYTVLFCTTCGEPWGCSFGNEPTEYCDHCIFVCDPSPDVITKTICPRCEAAKKRHECNPEKCFYEYRLKKLRRRHYEPKTPKED